jgi:hypothetical protein
LAYLFSKEDYSEVLDVIKRELAQ